MGTQPYTLLTIPAPEARQPPILSESTPQPIRVDPPESVLRAIDENHGNLLPVLPVELLVPGDVLLLPEGPRLGAHLLHHGTRVLAQMTVGLADEGDVVRAPGRHVLVGFTAAPDAPEHGTHTAILTPSPPPAQRTF